MFSPMEGLSPSVEELANSLHEFVNIDDVQELDTASDVEKLNKCGGGSDEVTCNQKGLSRYVSFPSPGKMISDYSSSDKEDEGAEMTSEKPLFPEPAAPVKLVSSMKGTREKQQGAPPEKLKVTWAPDVYDPTPTSVSHAGQRGAKQQKLSKKDKRRGKRGCNKGKDLSQGGAGGSKDKKKKKKKKSSSHSTTGPGTCYNFLDNGNELEPKLDNNFGFGIPDSCGSTSSSFFKVSMSSAHYPVAEAL